MSSIEYKKGLQGLDPKRVMVYKLWDKLIPIAYFDPFDEAYILFQVVCEMLNLNFDTELDRLLSHQYLSLHAPKVNYRYGNEDQIFSSSDFFLSVSVLPLWLAGIDLDTIGDKFSLETVLKVLSHLHAGMADQFNLRDGNSILRQQADLEQDIAETIEIENNR